MRLWILALPLLGCAPEDTSEAPLVDLDAPAADLFDVPPVDRAPAPGVLDLVSTPWLSTQVTTITVSNAAPGDTVALLFSGNPNTGPSCPPVMAPECMDLGSPRMFGTEVANGAGVATFTLTVPNPPPPVPQVQLQAVVLLVAGGADTSNAPIVDLHSLTSDLDADGLEMQDELAEGTDPENPDTDGGGTLDGDEVLNGTDPLDPGDDLLPTYTWTNDIYPLLLANCDSCHVNGGNSGGMNMDNPANVIGAPSNDVPTMNRIEPGDPDNSYIWHKLHNTQATVGGAGVQMPKGTGGVPLDQVDLDMIETWILEGAPE